MDFDKKNVAEDFIVADGLHVCSKTNMNTVIEILS